MARAPRNKTLTLTDDERQLLAADIADADALKGCATAADVAGKIVNADLLQVIGSVPDGMADLIIVDPPYNLRRRFGEMTFGRSTTESYETYLRSWFHDVCRKLRPDGSLYMCGDWRCTSAMQRVIEDEGLVIMNRITWQRDKGRGASANWKNAMEDIWFAVRDPQNYRFDTEAVKVRRRVRAPYRAEGQPKDWEQTADGKFRTTHPSNFWDDITIPFWSMPENTDHPTQKPEKLYAKLVLASSREGDLVFDPFMGSGTACVVAKKLGRRYLGVELDREYCLWAAARLRAADADRSIQGYADGVFWERNTQAEQNKLTIRN